MIVDLEGGLDVFTADSRRFGRATLVLSIGLALTSTAAFSNSATAAPSRPTVVQQIDPGPSPAAEAEGDGVWQRIATTGTAPSPRSSPVVVGLGDSVYVFGGVFDDFANGETTFYDDLYRLDTSTREWQPVQAATAPPPARTFAAAAPHASSGRMLLFGGSTFDLDGSEFAPLGDLWAFDPRSSRWDALQPANSGPGARSGAAMWVYGDELFVFGGLDATFAVHNDLWAYDLNTDRWQLVSADGDPSAPLPRHAAQAGQVAPGGVLTLYGGDGVDMQTGFTMLADTWQYDLANGTWQQVLPVSDLDPPHNDGAAAVLGPTLYLHGGDTGGGSSGCGAPFPQNTTDQLWRFDPATGAWRQLQPGGQPPPSLKRHAAATVAGTIYIVGGFGFRCVDDEGPGQVWNEDVYAYTP